MRCFTFFFMLCLQNHDVVSSYNTSQLGLTTFHGLLNHIWLLSSLVDSFKVSALSECCLSPFPQIGHLQSVKTSRHRVFCFGDFETVISTSFIAFGLFRLFLLIIYVFQGVGLFYHSCWIYGHILVFILISVGSLVMSSLSLSKKHNWLHV